MAKRIIQEDDLTKQEIGEDEEIFTLTIKKPGKGKGRSYEISASTATKLEQQLVAGANAKLPQDWTFGVTTPTKETFKSNMTLGDLEDIPTDEDFVAAKKMEVMERDEEPSLSTNSDCIHMNKGPIQTTLKNKKRYIYRFCRDCKTRIPEKKVREQAAYMNAELPPDTSFRSIEK